MTEDKSTKKKKPKFQRTKFRAYVKLGKGQKSKQKYRKATGRHNKTRQKEKGRPVRVEIGYKNNKKIRGLIEGKKQILIRRVEDLENISKDNFLVIAKIGNKKKKQIAEKAKEKELEISNLNVKRFLRKIERAKKYKEKLEQEKKKAKEKKKDKKEDKNKKEEESKNKDKAKEEKK